MQQGGSGNGRGVLVVDDDRGFLVSLEALLADEAGYLVETAGSGAEALEKLSANPGIDLVLSDLSMPRMDGLELLAAVHERRPGLPFIVMTAHGSVATAVEAMRRGAAQYLTKPVEPDELLVQVGRALAVAGVEGQLRELAGRYGEPGVQDLLIGSSTVVRTLDRTISDLAAVDSTVLIRGETGTGKELVARLIHRRSRRARRPFVVVNCTAIPRDLLESELFGAERGAYTGATTSRRGRIEEADGGSLLLDEVGDMPTELQPKLLRFLQERTVRRVGGDRERAVDVRVLAATHRDLEKAMCEGSFREDLFYRLETIPIEAPALRHRLEDLPELCAHLVARIAQRVGRPALPVSPEALDLLAGHPFPGNVRELENLLERALVLRQDEPGRSAVVRPEDLRLDPRRGRQLAEIPLEQGFLLLAERFADAERDLVRRALAAWPTLPNGEIAERLGTNRRVLELRMREYGLAKP